MQCHCKGRRKLFNEALRRGSKRLAYRNSDDLEGQEDTVYPRAKRFREEGVFGSGWEQITPERSPDPGKDREFQGRKIESKKPQRFADIFVKKEVVLQLSPKEETRGKKSSRHRVYTPVRTKIKRYEEITKEMGVSKSLRKVTRPKDKPGEGKI